MGFGNKHRMRLTQQYPQEFGGMSTPGLQTARRLAAKSGIAETIGKPKGTWGGSRRILLFEPGIGIMPAQQVGIWVEAISQSRYTEVAQMNPGTYTNVWGCALKESLPYSVEDEGLSHFCLQEVCKTGRRLETWLNFSEQGGNWASLTDALGRSFSDLPGAAPRMVYPSHPAWNLTKGLPWQH